MATAPTSTFPLDWTAVDMQEHLGGIPLLRIRMYPRPGLATEEDVLEIQARTGRLCELVDGILVEKTMGYCESLVASIIIRLLGSFVDGHDLGIVLGEAGALRILPNRVRIPDVSFLSWDRFPDRQLPQERIPAVAPDLAIEVLSKDNTPREMQRKLQEYFSAGVRLVWYIDPATRTARAYTAPDQSVLVAEDQALSGGDVLPGFELTLRDVFAKLPRTQGE
jgi:Uma2 family endonuclease